MQSVVQLSPHLRMIKGLQMMINQVFQAACKHLQMPRSQALLLSLVLVLMLMGTTACTARSPTGWHGMVVVHLGLAVPPRLLAAHAISKVGASSARILVTGAETGVSYGHATAGDDCQQWYCTGAASTCCC